MATNAAEKLLWRQNGGRDVRSWLDDHDKERSAKNAENLDGTEFHEFLSSILSTTEDVTAYEKLIPEKLSEFYHKHPEKRAYINHFIFAEIEDAKNNEGAWTKNGFMRKKFLEKETDIICSDLEKSSISLDNFKLYVKFLFALKEDHLNMSEYLWRNDLYFYGIFIPKDDTLFLPFQDGELDKILHWSQEIKENFLAECKDYRVKYLRPRWREFPLNDYRDFVSMTLWKLKPEAEKKEEVLSEMNVRFQRIERWLYETEHYRNSYPDLKNFNMTLLQNFNYHGENYKAECLTFTYNNHSYTLTQVRTPHEKTYVLSTDNKPWEELTTSDQLDKVLTMWNNMDIPLNIILFLK